MTRRSARTLDDLVSLAPRLKVTCQGCGRVRLFDGVAILAYFRQRQWSVVLNHACQRFICRQTLGGRYDRTTIGCGAYAAPHDRLPPKPPPPPTPIADTRSVKEEIRRQRG